MPNKPSTPARSVRLPDPLWAALQRIAEQTRLSTSEVVRLALEDWVKRHS